MNSLAVVRADDVSKVKTAVLDLVRHGHLTIDDKARKLEPAFADNILTHVMKRPLKAGCEAAAIVPLVDEGSAAIAKIRMIHPPAHVIIISPRHEIYHELVNFVDLLPEINIEFKAKNGAQAAKESKVNV